MLNNIELLTFIVVAFLATLLSRYLPFIVFNGSKKIPNYVNYLGKILPYCMTGFLVVYCLKDVSFKSYPFGIAELVAVCVVVLLHLWKKKTIISVVGGTMIYMVLIQFVFI
ncbi:MAG: AzlD domain-containing protein [Bacilli bacterium]|nr:AzlD domain-containing protein [Endomicrobiaceae bacterium]MDD3383852.1 AzlD domain-containing protein [Bacilli bacterium]